MTILKQFTILESEPLFERLIFIFIKYRGLPPYLPQHKRQVYHQASIKELDLCGIR